MSTICIVERRGLEFGAAACGAHHVSSYNYILLPAATPRETLLHAHVTQPTGLGHADAPGASGCTLHQHHIGIGVPRNCLHNLRGIDEYNRMVPQVIFTKTNIDIGAL